MKTEMQPIIATAMMLMCLTASAQMGVEGLLAGGPEVDGVVMIQGGTHMSGPFRGAMMQEDLFPPELVMHNQKMIGLKDDQQKAIRVEVQKVTAKVTDLQWDVTSSREEMASLVKAERVDEKQMLAQLDKLMNVETEIKRLQLALMIRIKNILTPEQQGKLRELREMRMPVPMGGPGAMHFRGLRDGRNEAFTLPMGGAGVGIAVPVPAPGQMEAVTRPMPAEPNRR